MNDLNYSNCVNKKTNKCMPNHAIVFGVSLLVHISKLSHGMRYFMEQ